MSKRLPKHLGRFLARKAVGDRSNRPVCFVQGDQAPEMCGESAHYETRGGSWIYHPAAYSKRGWSNMIYCNSTREVVVGNRWVAEAAKTWLAS